MPLIAALNAKLTKEKEEDEEAPERKERIDLGGNAAETGNIARRSARVYTLNRARQIPGE